MFVIALLLCGWSYANLGKLDESEATFARAVAAAESRHDQAHLAAAINNRITLWFGRAAISQLLADLQRVRDIARESGFAHMEGHVELNLGETLYCMGDLDVAADHARRALEAHARVGASARTINVPELLLARIAAYQGDFEAVQQALSTIEERSAAARERGDGDVDLLVTDQVILASVRLATSGARAERVGRTGHRCARGGAGPPRARRAVGNARSCGSAHRPPRRSYAIDAHCRRARPQLGADHRPAHSRSSRRDARRERLADRMLRRGREPIAVEPTTFACAKWAYSPTVGGARARPRRRADAAVPRLHWVFPRELVRARVLVAIRFAGGLGGSGWFGRGR